MKRIICIFTLAFTLSCICTSYIYAQTTFNLDVQIQNTDTNTRDAPPQNIYNQISNQNKHFQYKKRTNTNITSSINQILSNDAFSFYEVVKTFSEAPLYESFCAISKSTLKELLSSCTVEERFLLYGMFQYGIIDYLKEVPLTTHNLNQYATSMHDIMQIFRLEQDKKTSSAQTLLLKIINLQASTINAYDSLDDYCFTNIGKEKGKQFDTLMNKLHDHSMHLNDIKDTLSSIFLHEISASNADAEQSNTFLKDLSVEETKSNIQNKKRKSSSQSSSNYTIEKIDSDQTYKSGSIKIIIQDDISGQTTTGILTVFRDSALKWDTMRDTPTKWNCKLTFEDQKNQHNISMEQTTVTTVKDIYGYYFVMNFKLKLTQHAYYVYQNQQHIGSGNGFRLNFENYTQKNEGAGTITDGIVKADTIRTINWQINTAAIGLKTFDKKKYSNCKSYLNYTRPSHTIKINPNGGTYAASSQPTTYTKYTGEWLDLAGIPIRDHYLFLGYTLQGAAYTYRSSGIGMTTETGSKEKGFDISYSNKENYSKYTWRNINVKAGTNTYHYIRMNTYPVEAGHTVRITGYIRIHTLPTETSLSLYHGDGHNDFSNRKASYHIADGIWKKFDILHTFSSATDCANLEIYTSNLAGKKGSIQFDLKNIVLIDTTTNQRINDTNLQVGDGMNANATLTALWSPLLYKINYNAANLDASGSMPSHILQQDQTLTLKDCQFQSKLATFSGWKYDNHIYQPNDIIHYETLKKASQIHSTKTDADITPGEVSDENSFTMTALWDYKPVIELTNDPVTYIEGEMIKTNQLLNLVKSCTDKEDGNLMKQVTLKEIRYKKANDGYQPKKQTSFDHKTNLDTYFMHLQENEAGKAIVTYAVTDSRGNMATATKEITIRYNHPPVIKAFDLSFYQEEFKIAPDKIKQSIIKNASATDIEDDAKHKVLTINIQKPNPMELSKMQSPGVYEVTYHTKDSLRKETTLTTHIYVANSNPYPKNHTQSVRFISKEYLYTLNANSIWKIKDDYNQYLTQSLKKDTKKPNKSYTFTIDN